MAINVVESYVSSKKNLIDVRGHTLSLGLPLESRVYVAQEMRGRALGVRSTEAGCSRCWADWAPAVDSLRAKPKLPTPLLGSQSSAANSSYLFPPHLARQPSSHQPSQLKVCVPRALDRAFLAPCPWQLHFWHLFSLLRVVSLWNFHPHHGAGSPWPWSKNHLFFLFSFP